MKLTQHQVHVKPKTTAFLWSEQSKSGKNYSSKQDVCLIILIKIPFSQWNLRAIYSKSSSESCFTHHIEILHPSACRKLANKYRIILMHSSIYAFKVLYHQRTSPAIRKKWKILLVVHCHPSNGESAKLLFLHQHNTICTPRKFTNPSILINMHAHVHMCLHKHLC